MIRDLAQLFKSFLVLGTVSFGGYMALISMVRDELVSRRRIIDDETISEGTALASILPGPVAVNVVAYVGYRIYGLSGAVVSVVAVLLPSFVLVLLLTLLYFKWKTTFDFDSIVKGILPVIAAFILSVGYTMGKVNCRQWVHIAAAIISFLVLLIFPGTFTIMLILIAAAVFGVFLFRKQPVGGMVMLPSGWLNLLIFIAGAVLIVVISQTFFQENILVQLFSRFSMVSLTLFGGGYVMIPVLQNMLIDQLHWVSLKEFIYGISIGQVTPGPILISSVFFGYKVSGIPGSIVATLGIFLPQLF